MKFILTLQICSSLLQTCMPPITIDNVFDSWFSCGSEGYKSAYEINQRLGKEEVNKMKTYVRFHCKKAGIDS